MKISRRRFFKNVGFTALAVGTSSTMLLTDKILALSTSEAVKAGAIADPMAKSTFESLLDTAFQVQLPTNETLPLQLVNVLDNPIDSKLEQFSLTFRGPSQPFLAQNTYKFEHPHLGEFDLFITPLELGQEESEFSYQATINRLLN